MPDAFRRWLRSRDTQWGGAIALAVAIIYAMTLCPNVYWYDSAEFAAHAASLGVPHPPGYPLYTMIAHVFTWLPGDAALNVNLMSATFGVVSVWMLYGMARRLGASPASSTFAALLLATSATFWANAVVAEVYTPGLVFTLGVFVLLHRAQSLSRPWLVVLAGLVGGLGLGMHMSIATCGLGYAWLVGTHGIELRRWSDFANVLTQRWLLRIKVALGAGVAAVLGAGVFLYVPIRTFNRWDKREWVIFRKNATGGAFKRKFLENYDVDARIDFSIDIVVNNLHYVGIALALLGAAVLLRRRPRMGVALVLGAVGNVYWFFNYNVPDLDVFYLPAMAIGCLTSAFAVDATGRWLSRFRPALAEAQWLAVLLPVSLTLRNYDTVDLSHETEARAYAQEVCSNIESPSRIVSFSSPNEWRYYAVFLYSKQALGMCEGIEVWKKPHIADVRRSVNRGAKLYSFRKTNRLTKRFHLVDDGRLFRIEPRRRRSAGKRRRKRKAR